MDSLKVHDNILPPPPHPSFSAEDMGGNRSVEGLELSANPGMKGAGPFIPHWTGPSTLFDTQNVPRKPGATYPSSLDSHSEGHGQGHSRPEKGAFEKANPNCVSTLTVCFSCSVVSDSLQPHGL